MPLQQNIAPWRNRRYRAKITMRAVFLPGSHSGNAGLFLSLKDAITLGTFIIQEGTFGGKQILRARITAIVAQNISHGLKSVEVLGFKLHDSTNVDVHFGITILWATGLLAQAFLRNAAKGFCDSLTNRVYLGESKPQIRCCVRREFIKSLACFCE
jgi:CubicO group peptidase (beta-lactamase class C family)